MKKNMIEILSTSLMIALAHVGGFNAIYGNAYIFTKTKIVRSTSCNRRLLDGQTVEYGRDFANGIFAEKFIV